MPVCSPISSAIYDKKIRLEKIPTFFNIETKVLRLCTFYVNKFVELKEMNITMSNPSYVSFDVFLGLERRNRQSDFNR